MEDNAEPKEEEESADNPPALGKEFHEPIAMVMRTEWMEASLAPYFDRIRELENTIVSMAMRHANCFEALKKALGENKDLKERLKAAKGELTGDEVSLAG